MRKIWYVALIALCAMMATSCNKDDDEEKDDDVSSAWVKANQEAIFNISANKEYKEIKSQSNAGSIYVKVLKEGEDTQQIFYNSKVKCYYTGSFVAEYPDRNIEAGDIFDSSEPPYQNPAEFEVNGVVDGFTTALMNMHVGDRWEVWMPSQLAYGSSGMSKNGVIIIPGYSALKFEIEVVQITED